jgi:hypothetical protein
MKNEEKTNEEKPNEPGDGDKAEATGEKDKSEEPKEKEKTVEPVPVAEVTSEVNTTKKRAETGVKIRVGDNTDETKTEGVNTQDADMVESGYIESENPYLYDMSGVTRNVIDYG